jgi:tryptophan synthase alpha chain
MKPVLPFIMAGAPALEKLPAHLTEAAQLGVEAIEVGLPHSDPIADGPVLQAAAQHAVAHGATPVAVLEKLAECRASPQVVLFTYLNPLLQIGAPALVGLLRPTPVRSLLIVDLPFGEEPEFEAELRAAGYPIVPLLAPTTDVARAERLLRERPDPGESAPFAQRFAYVVARLGVTGTGQSTDLAPVARRVAELRRITARPLAVGFGLSDAKSLDAVRAMGAVPVVGSALVSALQQGRSLSATLQSLEG